MNQDTLQRFLFENKGIRGEIVHLHSSYRAIMECHPYPSSVAQLLGKALAASALLTAPLKYEGSLILQIQGDGVINPLVAQCNHLLQVRGMAHWQEDKLSSQTDHALLGHGQLAITIIPDKGKKRYQGIVNMDGISLSSAIENYFFQSEQLPTRLWLMANDTMACGFLLQQMPDDNVSYDEYWEHVTQLADTLSADELFSLANEEILHRLFHQEQVRLFESSPVYFRCHCNIQKMEQAIISCGREEIDSILSAHKQVGVTCEFCNRHYEFDKVDVEKIFRGI